MARGVGLTAGYAISLAGGVLSLMAYARVLGPDVYGRLAVYLAGVEAFQAIAFQWHRLALVRFWTADPDGDPDTYLVTSHIVWLVIASVASTVVCITLMSAGGSHPERMAFAVLALAKSAALYTQEMARATTAVARYALASLLLTVGATLASIAAWQCTHSLTMIMYAAAAVFALQSVVCGVDTLIAFRRARFNAKQMWRMLHYGLPLIPVFIATSAMTRLDRPILATFESARAVGVYAAASGLVSNAVTAACLLVVTPCYPWLLREMSSRSAADHRAYHARLGLMMLAGVFALCIAVAMLRDIAFPLMLGRPIGSAAQPLVIPLIAIATIAAFRAHFFDQAYHLHARTKALMGINFLTLLIAALAMYLGARFGGLEGLVYGLLITNVVALLASAMFSRSFVDVNRVVLGVGLLIVFAVLALSAGYVLRDAMNRIGPGVVWSTCLSAAFASSLFAAMCVGSNVGALRDLLKGNV